VRREVGGRHASRYSPGRARRRIGKAWKANETRRKKAAALGAEEQAADTVDTEREDGDETEGKENAIRGTQRGRRGTRQQVIDDSDSRSDLDGETRSQEGVRHTRR